jgi:hypothetical protein
VSCEGTRRIKPALKGGVVEENKDLARSPGESPVEELLKDDGPDVEGHALLERSPSESPSESPAERAPSERPPEM